LEHTSIVLKIKTVDIKFSVHDVFLESPSSGTLKITFIRYTQNNLRKVATPNNLKFWEQ
jgi:hypothetical protein